MKELVLERFAYSPTETEGVLRIGDEAIYTMERPWLPAMPGGVPFESCVPDGLYELVPHQRSNGDNVFALWNPDLHVYYTQDERGDKPGRYLILIHVGNYVEDVVGCIAPGMNRAIFDNRRMVTNSRKAMEKIMSHDWNGLVIRPALGATQ